MAQLIKTTLLPEIYAPLAKSILIDGLEVAPRGIKTRELDNVTIVVQDPFRTLPVQTNRGLHTAIAVVEALQLIAGVSVPELLVKVAPNMERFMEHDGNDIYQHGAYGVRTADQVVKLLKLLKRDSTTRQALMQIWMADEDLGSQSPDIPCTCTLRYVIRNEKLHATTVMRSNDIWWGTPYDVFQFTQLQITLARCLEVEVGTYTHTAMSLHAYEHDFEMIDGLKLPAGFPPYVAGVGVDAGKPWPYYQLRAESMLHGYRPDDASLHEKWMFSYISKYFD